MGEELRHETAIDATPEEVWRVLVDVDGWPAWNPTLTTADGPLVEDRWVKMTLRLGPVHVKLPQHITAVEAPNRLAWRTRNLFDKFMDVDRTFHLAPTPGGGTLLIQAEVAHGPVAPLAMLFLKGMILDGFVALGEALRRQLEPDYDESQTAAPPARSIRKRTMSDAPRKGQTDWRKEINQHETFDHDSIDSLAYDWDRIGDPDGPPRFPLKFYVPQNTEDVVRCVKECATLGQVLTVRSKGHSSNDLVTPVGGAVLLSEKLHGVIEVDEQAMTATVWSGTPSADVDDHLATMGLGLPVIGDHAHITVGGFASVGGITASSFKYGMFVDIIQRLEYVDWEGEVHVVDRTDGVDEFHRLLMGLGRHGVITKVTVTIIAIEKYETYWRNDDTRYRQLDDFITGSRDLCAEPPDDATFLRGLWVDFPMSSGKSVEMGTFSVYRDADPSLARRGLESVAYGGLHRLGWLAGRLPEKVDKVVKLAGMAGVVLAPKYATVKNAEFFTEKILDATVGDPQRFLVVISPIGIYEEQFRLLWDMMVDYRTRYRCFTFITLYVKSIKSPYLAQGDPGNERWVEFLFYVGIDPDIMTDALLDQIAHDLDQNCIDTGSFRYMHTRTGRDPERLAKIDPNAPYNGGVSVHPSNRDPGAGDA